MQFDSTIKHPSEAGFLLTSNTIQLYCSYGAVQENFNVDGKNALYFQLKNYKTGDVGKNTKHENHKKDFMTENVVMLERTRGNHPRNNETAKTHFLKPTEKTFPKTKPKIIEIPADPIY